MGNTKRKNKPIGDCPVGCKDITLEVPCQDYKNHTSYPMPEYPTPKGWKVNTKKRADCGVSSTVEMQDKFKKEFSKKNQKNIPNEMQTWAKETYGIEAEYGKDLLNALDAGNHAPQMHHNLPIVLGGLDDPSNYIPLPHDEHQKSAGGVHKWWDDTLNHDGSDDLEKQLGKCKSKSNNTDKKMKKKEEALNDCSRNISGTSKSTCEGKIGGIAACLKKVKPPEEGVDLYVRCEQ